MQHLSLQILQTLHKEHLAIMSLLERLESLLRQNGPDQAPPADDGNFKSILDELVAIMEKEISHHYSFEEEHLFPRFSELADAGIPMMLKGEHDAIRPLAQNITALARQAQAGGFTAETWRQFHALGEELVEREVFHVQKEEMGFLPGLQQLLDPSEDSALVAAYEEKKSAE